MSVLGAKLRCLQGDGVALRRPDDRHAGLLRLTDEKQSKLQKLLQVRDGAGGHCL